jgi:hypothetical protein
VPFGTTEADTTRCLSITPLPNIPELNAASRHHNTTLAATLAATLLTTITGESTEPFNTATALSLQQRAWEKVSTIRNIERAVRWASLPNGLPFRFSTRTLQAHHTILTTFCNNSLDNLILRQQNILRSRGRLSHVSIAATITPAVRAQLTDLRDEQRIHDLVLGIRIPTSRHFIPQSSPEPLRPRFRLAMPAVHKLFQSQIDESSVIVLPTVALSTTHTIHPIHYQSLGWTTKAENDCGRVTGDMSYTTWVSSLNGLTADTKADVRSQIVAMWGDISLPDLNDIAHDILDQADKHGWENISLYKKDVKAAFHRLLFHPDSVGLTAFALDELYTILHLVGNFGWTGTPFAWDVIGRIMLAAARITVTGSLRLYVDDFFGACLTTCLRSNNSAVDTVIRTLLGQEALAPNKDVSGRVLVILGWFFDLDNHSVSISEANLLKTLGAFMTIETSMDRSGAVTLQQLERAASLATRYSVLCRQMSAFISSMYNDIAGFKGNHQATHRVSNNTRVDIEIWRAYLILVGTQPHTYSRQLDTFRPKAPPSIDIGFDGSLGGLGVGVRTTSTTTTLAHTGIFPVPCLPTTDSSYQNTFELMAVVVGLLLCLQLGYSNFSYSASGDSTVTLSWLQKDKISSTLGRRAAIAYALISATIGATNTHTTFVPGKENTLFDALSRGWSTAETRALHPLTNYPCPPGSPIYAILSLIDPQLPSMTTLETFKFITVISAHISTLQRTSETSGAPQEEN